MGGSLGLSPEPQLLQGAQLHSPGNSTCSPNFSWPWEIHWAFLSTPLQLVSRGMSLGWGTFVCKSQDSTKLAWARWITTQGRTASQRPVADRDLGSLPTSFPLPTSLHLPLTFPHSLLDQLIPPASGPRSLIKIGCWWARSPLSDVCSTLPASWGPHSGLETIHLLPATNLWLRPSRRTAHPC